MNQSSFPFSMRVASSLAPRMVLRQVTTRTVTIIIESTPIEVTLEIGETKEVDVDADRFNDISVTLNDIVGGVADISTKRLTPLPEEVPTEEVPPEEVPEEEITPETSSSKAWLWILVVVILVVLVLGYFILKKKGSEVVSVEEKETSAKRKKK